MYFEDLHTCFLLYFRATSFDSHRLAREMGSNYDRGAEFLFGMMKDFWKWIMEMVVQHHGCT